MSEDFIINPSVNNNVYATVFLKRFRERPQATDELKQLLKNQRPLFEHTSIGESELYGLYYMIPLQDISSSAINGTLIYPVDSQKSEQEQSYNGTLDATPSVLDAKILNYQILVTSRFLYSYHFLKWKEKGLKVQPDLTAFAEKLYGKEIPIDHLEGFTPCTKSISSGCTYDIMIYYEVVAISGENEDGEAYISQLSIEATNRAFKDNVIFFNFNSPKPKVIYAPSYVARGVQAFSIVYFERARDMTRMVHQYMSQIQTRTGYRFDYQISVMESHRDDPHYTGGGSGGGSSSSGSTSGGSGQSLPPSTPKPPKNRCPICGRSNCTTPHDDCDDAKQVYKTSTMDNYDLLSTTKGPYSHNPSFEDFISTIKKDKLEHSTYLNCVKENGDTTYYLGNIETGTTFRVPMYATSNTIADIHNHPELGNAPPSGQDIIHTASNAKKYDQFQRSYIYAANGDVYCLYVADHSKAGKFYDNFCNSIDTTTNLFQIGGELNESWKKADKLFEKFAENQRMEYKLAYILSEHNAGIKILKKPNGESSFSTIDVKKQGEYHIPTICK